MGPMIKFSSEKSASSLLKGDYSLTFGNGSFIFEPKIDEDGMVNGSEIAEWLRLPYADYL